MYSSSVVSQKSSRPRTDLEQSRKANAIAMAAQSLDFDILHRDDWISLGDGWFQTTPDGTGKTVRCGLHNVFESSPMEFYMCLHEPLSREAYFACTSALPEYNVEAQIKLITSRNPGHAVKSQYSNFYVLLAVKSPRDYIAIICDMKSQCWILTQCINGDNTILKSVTDSSVRTNSFCSLLLLIRGNCLSVFINKVPIFTTLKLTENDALSGLVGIAVKGSKVAIKNWKVGRPNRAHVNNVLDMLNGSKEQRESDVMSVAGSLASQISRRPYSATGSKSRAISPPLSARSIRSSNKLVQLSSYDIDDAAQASTALKLKHQQLQDEKQLRGGKSGEGMIDLTFELTIEDSPTTTPSKSLLSQSQDSSINAQEQIAYYYDMLRNIYDDDVINAILRDVLLPVRTVKRNVVKNRNHDEEIELNSFRLLNADGDDITSLTGVKRLLNEAIMLPLLVPDFFRNNRLPWKGVLVYGPPGTGKTMICETVCKLHQITYFHCTTNSLLLKYADKCDSIIKCLFDTAKLCKPSVVFFDGIDTLNPVKNVNSYTYAAYHRAKDALYKQIDQTQYCDGVTILATTNRPWNLEEELIARFERRILIPLPDQYSREDIFRNSLKHYEVDDNIDVTLLAEISEGYNGADIQIVCREASMKPMRRLLVHVDPAHIRMERNQGSLAVPKIRIDDIMTAISNTLPSLSADDIQQYYNWDYHYGTF